MDIKPSISICQVVDPEECLDKSNTHDDLFVTHLWTWLPRDGT